MLSLSLFVLQEIEIPVYINVVRGVAFPLR